MRDTRCVVLLSLLPAAVLIATGCSPARPPVTEAEALGEGILRVSVPYAERSNLDDIFDEVRLEASEVVEQFNPFDPKSDLSAINRVAATARIPIDRTTYRLFTHALRYSRETDNAFDITAAPLLSLWGFRGGIPPYSPVSPDVLQASLRGVGPDRIILEQQALQFRSSFTRVDVSGILPGYAVDLSLLRLRRQGWPSALIRYGGSARCLGAAADGSPWSVPLSHPEDPATVIGSIALKPEEGVSISRFDGETVTIEDRVYCSILDPRTGYPVENMQMAAVTAPTATRADALATALFVEGPGGAGAILRRFPDCEALLIPRQKPYRILATEGFAVRFSPGADWQDRVEPLSVQAGDPGVE